MKTYYTDIDINFKKVKKERMQKGKSLLELPKNYCLIDIETTGLDATFDDAIEVAVIKVRENKIIDEYQSLIYTDQIIDSFIVELTGIQQNDILGAPKPEIVWKEFKSFIKDEILIAHNANFDINFIYDEMIENKIEPINNDFVDTLRLARRAFPDMKNHKLKTLVKELELENDKLHRAMKDVQVTYQLYNKILNLITQEDLNPKSNRKKFKITDIKIQELVENEYITNNTFAFTGKLEYYTRKEAMQIVVNNGGAISSGVTKKVNYLVMGTYDYYSGIKDGKSSKHKKAEKYKEQGLDIDIIPETIFYEILNKE